MHIRFAEVKDLDKILLRYDAEPRNQEYTQQNDVIRRKNPYSSSQIEPEYIYGRTEPGLIIIPERINKEKPGYTQKYGIGDSPCTRISVWERTTSIIATARRPSN